jgi:DHA1 family tetracycline resistance protein-like MFS transporter
MSEITIESQPLLENARDGEETKISPYSICLPIFLSLTAAMVFGIQQQWIMTFLCSRFVKADGITTLPELSTEYLPGIVNSYPILQMRPEWDSCRKITEIQISSSHWTLALTITSGVPSLIMGPVYGMLSDRFGRKPFILLGMISALFFYLAYLSISFFNLGLWLLLMTSVINGFLGSYYILLTNTLAFFADTSSSNERGQVFVLGESVFLGGFALGPILGGYIARHMENGLFNVFVIATVLNLIIFVFTMLFLPESLRKKDISTSNSSLADKTMYQMLEKSVRNVVDVFREASTTSFFVLLAGFVLIVSCAGSGRSIFFYYVSLRFGWDSQDEGQFILVAAGTRMFHMLISYPFLARVFSSASESPERKMSFDLALIKIGLLIASLSALMQALASVSWYLYIIVLFDGFGALVSPTIQSLLSSSVSKSTQALLFSGITFSSQVVTLLFSPLMPVLWSNTAKTIPNLFLFVVGIFYGLAGLLITFGISETMLIEARDKVQEADQRSSDLFEQGRNQVAVEET